MDESINKEITLAAFQALQKELQGERIKSSVAILGTILSILLSLTTIINNRLPNATTPSAATSAEIQTPTFQKVTARAIQINDTGGDKVATIDNSGITFFHGYPTIRLISGGKVSTTISPGYEELDGDTPGNNILSISPWSVDFSQSDYQNMSASYGQNGLSIFGKAYDLSLDTDTNGLSIKSKLSPPPGELTYMASAFYGGNGMSLSDNKGIERASIGQTLLTTPGTGLAQITSLSSIVLFDTSGHVIWQTP